MCILAGRLAVCAHARRPPCQPCCSSTRTHTLDRQFQQYCSEAYIILRRRGELFINLMMLMKDANIPVRIQVYRCNMRTLFEYSGAIYGSQRLFPGDAYRGQNVQACARVRTACVTRIGV